MRKPMKNLLAVIPREDARRNAGTRAFRMLAFAFPSRGICISALLALVLSASALAQQPSRMKETRTEATAVAIKGGKLLTITHGTIENGVVVIENGKITSVGPAATTQ